MDSLMDTAQKTHRTDQIYSDTNLPTLDAFLQAYMMDPYGKMRRAASDK